MQIINNKEKYFNKMKKIPKEIYFKGNLALLDKFKISIVGSRHPNTYARNIIYEISNKLAQNNNIIVSGGAIGIDTIAHKAASFSNTIMVAGTGLDKKYPKINKSMIEEIENKGLIISQFEPNTTSYPRNFAIRNELIVALGDILIVAYADENSGTMRSVEYALKMNKKIYVLPHRIGESEGTNKLLEENKAQGIYDVNKFIQNFSHNKIEENFNDELLEFCKSNPSYEEAINKFKEKVFEYELLGKIYIENAKVYLKR